MAPFSRLAEQDLSFHRPLTKEIPLLYMRKRFQKMWRRGLNRVGGIERAPGLQRPDKARRTMRRDASRTGRFTHREE